MAFIDTNKGKSLDHNKWMDGWGLSLSRHVTLRSIPEYECANI
jgi:hypothetical protein